MSEGRFGEASNDLLLALGVDPQHPEAARLAPDARRRAGAQRAARLIDEGATAEHAGRVGAALAAYRAALEADPGNVRAGRVGRARRARGG